MAYLLGQQIRIGPWTTAISGVATDATVVLTITHPDGTTTTATPTRVAAGTYQLDYQPTQAGAYSFLWTAAGAVTDTAAGAFDVIAAPPAAPLFTVDELAALTGQTIDPTYGALLQRLVTAMVLKHAPKFTRPYPDHVCAVALEVAARGVTLRGASGLRARAQTIGSYSESKTFAGDGGAGASLYLTEEDLKALRGSKQPGVVSTRLGTRPTLRQPAGDVVRTFRDGTEQETGTFASWPLPDPTNASEGRPVAYEDGR